MMLSKRRTRNPFLYPDMVAERVEKMKASIRAKVEHPFRVLKRQFGYTKVRYLGLAKNTAQIVTLFALSILWMARREPARGAEKRGGEPAARSDRISASAPGAASGTFHDLDAADSCSKPLGRPFRSRHADHP